MSKIPVIRCLVVCAMVLCCAQAFAQVTIDFDDGALPPGVQAFGTAAAVPTGGNPNGYLRVTDAANSQRGAIVFPDLTGGAPVTLLNIKADLRVGGGTDRPADGFSFNLARPGDPVLDDGQGFAGWGTETDLPEEGTTTGLGIGFDEWDSGGGDVVGMSVRIDNTLVQQIALPTLNGTLEDITSLQTGPRGPAGAGDISVLGWAPFEIDLQADKTLKISWKNNVVFNGPIAIEPFAGQLVFGGRTGGANAAHHIDNIQVTIPEPSSVALAATGVGIVLLRLRRRR